MLPKISTPTAEILVPSLNKKLKFRPFLYKEEKILLMAGESDDEKDIILACKEIIEACCKEEIDVGRLAVFDLEYVFLKLRAISVNNICKVSFTDMEDEKDYDFDINLNQIELVTDENHTDVIEIGEGVKIKMKYPTVDITDTIAEAKSEADLIDKMVKVSIDKIYDGETVYEDYTDEELQDFLDNLPSAASKKIKDFFETMPKLLHIIKYTNSKGTERTITLRSLKDFFIWA